MNENENAVPSVQTENGNGQILFDGFKPPENNDTTMPGKLEAFLLRGHQDGIPAGDLAKLLGLSDTRQLRLMVQKARETGSPILSGATGYFLPDANPAIAEAERKACASRLRSMGCSLMKAARQIEEER